MRNVFVLACLVARAAAADHDPSISTDNGTVVIVAEDLHFTRNNASGGAEIDISLIDLASRIDTLASQLVAVNTGVASNTLSVGILAADVASNTADVASNTRSVGTLTADVDRNTRSVGTLIADVASNTANVASNTANIANLTAEICHAQQFDPRTFEYKGINARRGKHSRMQISGNSRQYKSVSSNANPDDIFDGFTGRWCSNGACYRGENNNNGGGMEVRFETPVHIASWIVRCIRNTEGQKCYSNGGYDFTYIEVDYWASNRWNRAGTLNARSYGDWHSDYAGSVANARSQNWRFWIPRRNPRGQPQHANRNSQPHASEIEIFGC
jgi:hypothetical protein